jgi:sulfide:quinone oxidoreductase
MPTPIDAFRVLIAGGGVAGLEGLLAIRELAAGPPHVEVLAPETEFSYRQLAVAEPFSLGEIARFDLTELIEGAGGVHRLDSLAEVRAAEQVAVTAAGAEVSYDALLLAVGAGSREALPGAITYRGLASNTEVHEAILALDREQISSLGFAVPATVRWALPLYELALLAAAHLADIGDAGKELHLVTAEPQPLALFGARASQTVRALLDEAGVSLHAGVAPARVELGGLALMNGERIECERVIALPELEVRPIPGVPQGPHGFIGTDMVMRVDGLRGVFCAGDAAWFPIKQGGLAAQQADAAASAIAAEIDPEAEERPFRPVLRAAMLTGSGPHYLRAALGHPDRDHDAASSAAPLWWPPAKVAGRYLAPYIAARASETNQPSPPLGDLDPEGPRGAEEHREAIAMALAGADADAAAGDHRNALRWLAVAEQLELTLPAEYSLKREQWRRALGDAAC